MAITCPRCGAGFDVTLFQFGHRVRCDCGAWVGLATGHLLSNPARGKEVREMAEEEIGKVTHYFGHINVAAIEITSGTLRVGDTIHIKGHTSDFTQTVDSIQIEKHSVEEAGVGEAVGIKVAEHAREHDVVFKVAD
ncbi:MAG: EF-Tu/IF-2/RF-3 family GTPase [Planctomycetota bacterium]